MYAVIETGGKQYRVELGSEIEVDRMDVEPGQTIDIERVLLIADGDEAAIGQPVVDGAIVSASVLRQSRGDKIVVFKYKPKARTRVKQGHRADLTVLRIADIAWAGRSAAEEQATIDKQQRAAAEVAAKAAATQAAADAALAQKLAAAAAAAAPPAAATKPVKKAKPKAAETAVAVDTEAAADTDTTEAAAEPVIAAPEAETTDALDAGADAATDETGKDE
jgi:large subunit ribosomal protein L21